MVYNHDNLFNDDPFPDFTNNPFERTMNKINNRKRDIDEKLFNIDTKYQNLMSNLVQVAHKKGVLSTQKRHDYPMIKASLYSFRKDEIKLSKDKMRHKKSFYELFETRLNKIPGDRETVSISIDVIIRNSFNYFESVIKLSKKGKKLHKSE